MTDFFLPLSTLVSLLRYTLLATTCPDKHHMSHSRYMKNQKMTTLAYPTFSKKGFYSSSGDKSEELEELVSAISASICVSEAVQEDAQFHKCHVKIFNISSCHACLRRKQKGDACLSQCKIKRCFPAGHHASRFWTPLWSVRPNRQKQVLTVRTVHNFLC